MRLDESLFNEVESSYKVGDTIRIIEMKGEPSYAGKTGVIKYIDDLGQLHGTWGGLAVIPEEDTFEVIDIKTVNEAMYTNISSNPYDLNIMTSKLDDKAGRDWKYVKSFKFKDDAIERANRMIANGEAYVAQVYSWLDEDHGEIYFRKADDGKVIDKSAQRVDCEIHGPELRTKSDKTVIRPIRESNSKTTRGKRCIICSGPIVGYGNNAEPVKVGRCCDSCNATVVIPARIKSLFNKDNLKESVNTQNVILNNYQKQALLDNLFEDEELHDFYTNKLNTEWIISSNKELDPIRTPEDDKQFPYVLIIDNEFVDALSADFANKYMNLTESVEGDKMMQDRIDDKNADFEADQQTTRNMRMKLADQGIATDTNGKPFTEDIEIPDGVEDAGTSQYGDRQFKYKGYTIAHFPIHWKVGEEEFDAESFIIESPAVLKSGYHLPLYCEDETGEVVNFLTLQAAKMWIDNFHGKYKLDVKFGNEIHAVIKDTSINESLNEDASLDTIRFELNGQVIDDMDIHTLYKLIKSDYRINEFNGIKLIKKDELNSIIAVYLNDTNYIEIWIKPFDQAFADVPAHLSMYLSHNDSEPFDVFGTNLNDIFEALYKMRDRYNEQSVNESLNEDVTVEADTSTENNGLATVLNYLIKDEFDAIQGYNDAIVNFETEGRSDLVQVLKDIVNEENLHVGQLEVLLEQVSGAANSIDQGKAEAETQLTSTQVFESLNNKDMSTYSKALVNAYTDEEIQKLLQELRTYGRQDLYNKAMELKRSGSDTSWKYVAKEISNIIYNEVNEVPEEGAHY